jgi:ATP-dependent Clp protease ATP-binding subunit ClpC
MNELTNSGNTILYIDEIQELVPAKAEKSGHSLASIMAPFILEGKFPIIGTINYADYKKYFYSNESLRQSFENIEVSELSPHDTLKIIETQIDYLEENFNLYLSFPAITAAIELSQRYISERKLPDSAVRTLEAACSWAQSQKIKRLTNEHVAKYVSIQTNVPVETITAEEASRLMNLEQTMQSKVIGQDEAVHKVVETLKRARTDIRDPNKPMGVFLFLGPTGTGKTHLGKVLSKEYFGSKSDIVKVDMSEYQDIQSIQKFLGSNSDNSAYTQNSVTLLDRIKSNPFTVVLFDEIEKAHPQVLDLFLQLFDEGRLTSNMGETVKFTNTVIICTSNIGSKILLDALQKDNALWEEAKARSLIELQQAIRPELLNRFDNIIVFAPHSIENLIKISIILLNDLAKRVSEKGIVLNWDNKIPMLIADRAQVPGMGARPLKRFIQEKIEGKIATEVLTGNLESGSTVSIKESWLQ